MGQILVALMRDQYSSIKMDQESSIFNVPGGWAALAVVVLVAIALYNLAIASTRFCGLN